MKKIELLESVRNDKDNDEIVKENKINHYFYWAYKQSQRLDRDIMNIDDLGFEDDHKAIIENLKRFGIEEFTISSQSTGLMNGLKSFKEGGYFPVDLIEVDSGNTNWNFDKHVDEKVYVPALLFKVQ